jgi:hypothetical protein
MGTAHGTALVGALLLALATGGCSASKRSTSEGLGREDWQEPDAVMALLGIDPGDFVVDYDAGDGTCPSRLADAVGKRGRVVALEGSDPLQVPAGSVDLLFLCDTYQRVSDPVGYFRNALYDLAPNGRVAIVELRSRTSADQIAREMGEAGYERIANHEILPRQSFQIFRADDGTGE